MLDVFLVVVLPVFLVAAIAAVFQRFRRLPMTSLSQVTLYLFTPALIFVSLLDQQLPIGASLRIVAATILGTTFILIVGALASRFLRHDRPMQSAFLLATAFPNAGNMALPVLLLAFGQEGLNAGVMVFLTQAVLGNSVGIIVAARSQTTGWEPLKQVFKLPTLYAIVAAALVRFVGLDLPVAVYAAAKLLAQAAIPVMLVVLGLQLGGTVKFEDEKSLAAALVLRLALAGPLAWLAAALVGLQGIGAQAVVIVASMPVAVFTTILATQFNARPRFVTNAVLASTFVSVLTLTVIITLTQRSL